MNQTPHASGHEQNKIDPFKVSASMLRQDAALLIPLFLLLNATTIADALLPTRTVSSLGSLLLAERVLQSIVVALISIRWAHRFERTKRGIHHRITTIRKIVVFSMGIWCLATLPFFLAAYASNALARIILLTSGFVGISWALKYYFFFAVTALVGGKLPLSLRMSLLVALSEPRAALRSLAAPLGLTALATAALLSPFPDGRSLIVNSIAASAEGIFWILSTYTGFAFTLIALDDSEWRRVGLEPYRIEQLRTLEARGRGLIARLLQPSAGLKMLALALLIYVANLSRGLAMTPAASIQVKNIEFDDYRIRVEVTISDPTYDFRGFQPLAFRIASKSGDKISEELVRASLSPEKTEKIYAVPASSEPRSLFLEFRSNKSKENLEKINYAWLWYQLVPLEQLPSPARRQ